MMIQRYSYRRLCSAGCVTFLLLVSFYTYIIPCSDSVDDSVDNDRSSKIRMASGESNRYVHNNHHVIPYDRGMPLIFVGGIPRSGTTLMRAMLDAHPEVRCGEETRVIPRVLGMRSQWSKSARETTRLQEAGLSDEVLDSAIAAFILEIIVKHGEPAERLCNKDPFTLNSSVYLAQMFPASKFILMVRDGRAVVHSIITRKVTISGFDLKSYRNCLQKWNQAIESMYYQCLKLGPSRCMIVFYEQMVLHPKEWMENILTYLNLHWNNSVLHHHQFINKPGGVSLSKTERSTSQVIKPVNLEALTRWVGAIPEDVKRDMRTIAPMLEKLGYDPNVASPNYGDPDRIVQQNTVHIKEQQDYWRQREQQVQNNGKKDMHTVKDKIRDKIDVNGEDGRDKIRNNVPFNDIHKILKAIKNDTNDNDKKTAGKVSHLKQPVVDTDDHVDTNAMGDTRRVIGQGHYIDNKKEDDSQNVDVDRHRNVLKHLISREGQDDDDVANGNRIRDTNPDIPQGHVFSR